MLANQNQLVVLVKDFAAFDDNSLLWPFGCIALFFDRNHYADRVSDKYRLDEP